MHINTFHVIGERNIEWPLRVHNIVIAVRLALAIKGHIFSPNIGLLYTYEDLDDIFNL